jgi:hypothetical protein
MPTAIPVRFLSLALFASLAACSSSSDESKAISTSSPYMESETGAAVWELDTSQPLTDSSTKFTALVSRKACNDGVTGKVVEPRIESTALEVVVTFRVSPQDPEGANCPGNELVPYTVDLGEELGSRRLVDGQCRDVPSTPMSLCDESRWERP